MFSPYDDFSINFNNYDYNIFESIALTGIFFIVFNSWLSVALGEFKRLVWDYLGLDKGEFIYEKGFYPKAFEFLL